MRHGLTSREFTINTGVPSHVLMAWLQLQVGRRSGLFTSSAGPIYHGQITPIGFSLRRHVNYQAGFQPVVTGVFRPHAHGAVVDVAVRFPAFGVAVVVVITVFGLLAATLFGVAFAVTGLFAEEPGLIALLFVGPVLAAVFVTVMIVSVALEARQSQRDLGRIFSGQPARPPAPFSLPPGPAPRPPEAPPPPGVVRRRLG